MIYIISSKFQSHKTLLISGSREAVIRRNRRMKQSDFVIVINDVLTVFMKNIMFVKKKVYKEKLQKKEKY